MRLIIHWVRSWILEILRLLSQLHSESMCSECEQRKAEGWRYRETGYEPGLLPTLSPLVREGGGGGGGGGGVLHLKRRRRIRWLA